MAGAETIGAAQLLEREQELATLAVLRATATAGGAGVGLIEGAAGIGKSQLLVEAGRQATIAGLRVLWARGGELEREFAFGVVRQLFEPVLAGDDGSLTAGAASAARAVFEVDPARDDGADPSFASLHGLYWLTVNLSLAEPLLLVVDDLHWCDRPSLRFLVYLTRRLEGLPINVLAGLRPAQRGADAGLMGELAGGPLTVVIRPRPLSVDAVAELVRDRLGHDATGVFSTACHSATDGNPLLLAELLRTLAAEGVHPDAQHVGTVADLGPRAVSRSVLLRLHRLPFQAVAFANAVAVLGPAARLDIVAGLAGLSMSEAAEAMDALEQAEILQPGIGTFVHPLVGAAVYDDLSRLERAAKHQRAADLLSSMRAPAEQIAAHLTVAPPRGQPAVVEVLQRAAAAALAKGAPDVAVNLLSRALVEPPPAAEQATVLLELGRAETMVSGPAAADHLAEAYDLITDPMTRAMTAQALARALVFTGQPGAGAAVARSAAAEVPAELADLRDALEACECLAVLIGGGSPDVLRRLAHHRTLPTSPGIGAKMLAAIAAQEWMYAGGPSEACAELSLAALSGGELIAADNGLSAACAITNLVLADRPEAMDACELARADAHRRGSLFAIAVFDVSFGHALLRRGELVDAESSLRSALAGLDLWGYRRDLLQIYCDAFLSAVLRERGDLPGARAALHTHDFGGDDQGARYWCDSQIELLLAAGRFDAALAAVDGYAARFGGMGRTPVDAPWRSHKALALHRMGRAAEARLLAEEELQLARHSGAPGTVARSLRTVATVAPGDALSYLHEAVEVVGESTARLEAAKSFGALGRALRLARQPSAARQPLRRAVELAAACGAVPVEERARAELHAAGGRPRPTALAGTGSLTASERRVAARASEGATNRDIAQELFITLKTVETHLSSVYRKLGIRSRHELPGALGADI